MLKCKHLPGAAETRHDLVEDQQHVILIAPRPELSEDRSWPHPHTGSTLNERLDDHARSSTPIQRLQLLQIRNAGYGELMTAEAVMKNRNPTQARCAERIAVIGVFEGDESDLFTLPVLLEVLDTHFNRHLDRSRSVVGEEHLAQPGLRYRCDQMFRQLYS